jgi:hypothetical protein
MGLNYFLIDFDAPLPISMAGAKLLSEIIMKNIHKIATALAIAFSAAAFVTMAPPSAEAGPITPPGTYCLQYDLGGTDCSFTSYPQCEATASGEGAECYGNTARDDKGFHGQGRRGYESPAQGY